MRPILLGMNNPQSAKPSDALYPHPVGCAGWRVLEMLRRRVPEATVQDYLVAFDRRNLLNATVWNGAEAKLSADEFVRTERKLAGRTVVTLGDKVRSLLGLEKDLIHPHERSGVIYRQLPHPSGLCRWYNEPQCLELTSLLLEDLYRKSRGER